MKKSDRIGHFFPTKRFAVFFRYFFTTFFTYCIPSLSVMLIM